MNIELPDSIVQLDARVRELKEGYQTLPEDQKFAARFMIINAKELLDRAILMEVREQLRKNYKENN